MQGNNRGIICGKNVPYTWKKHRRAKASLIHQSWSRGLHLKLELPDYKAVFYTLQQNVWVCVRNVWVCVYVGFVMWGCFGNMYTCIYCVLYCLYCVFLYCFVYVYLLLFVLFVLV